MSYPSTSRETFAEYLKGCDRIMALLGAGLSASSGLPTFRGAGGLWRNNQAVQLATPEAFKANPGLVWQFYSHRRHMALSAKPNKAHFALAELAKRNPNFLTLSQNVDGLSTRAGHPSSQLLHLHGSLFDVKCSGFYCDYADQDDYEDPIVPALAIPKGAYQPEPASTTDGMEAANSLRAAMAQSTRAGAEELDISDASVPLPQLDPGDLPLCPKCQTNLLRPGVVWFNECLPKKTIKAADDFILWSERIDLIMVIGTTAQVWPAAGYVDEAVDKGARVAVINLDRGAVDSGPGDMGLTANDWFFQGDAGQLVPEILKSVIGEI